MWWSIIGCGIVATDRCETDADCVAAFGWGHTCGDRGSCDVLEPGEGCASAWPADVWSDRDRWRDAVVFGAIIDSGPFAIERDAVRLAVDQVNDLGGIDGLPVAVIECDPIDATGAERAPAIAAMAARLSGPTGARAIVGPIASSDAGTAAAAAVDAILVSPGASAISLAEGAGAPVWRTVPSDADLAQAVVRDLIDEGLGATVVVHARDTGQTELAEALHQFAADAAGEYAGLSADPLAFASATERDARIVEAAYAGADAVVLLSEDPNDYVQMLLAASAIPEYEQLVVFVGPAAYRPSLLTDAAAASALFPNLRGVRSATREGAVADVFRASFASAYDGADSDRGPYAGQAYDSAWSVFSAVLWSGMRYGAVTTDGLTEGLGGVSFGLPLALGPSGWSDLAVQFGSARTVDLDGASSPLDFEAATRAIRGPVAIWNVEDGQFVTIREYAF
ncbi:MAG: ABC transporter substrate-binding protein [Myxococcota bacterium]